MHSWSDLLGYGRSFCRGLGPTRKRFHAFNRSVHKRHNVIERAFCRLKDWRRVATRYDNCPKLPLRCRHCSNHHLVDLIESGAQNKLVLGMFDAAAPGISSMKCTAIAVFALLQGLAALQVLVAYWDGFLTVGAMEARGIPQGLPLAWHFGIWGDALVVSPLAAAAVLLHGDQWKKRDVASATGLAAGATLVCSWLFAQSTTPTAHGLGWDITTAGYLHLVYMLAALTIFLLFYVFSSGVRPAFLTAATVLLVVHTLFGMHMVLGLIALPFGLRWYPDRPLQSLVGWAFVLFMAVALPLRAGYIRRRSLPFPPNRFR